MLQAQTEAWLSYTPLYSCNPELSQLRAARHKKGLSPSLEVGCDLFQSPALSLGDKGQCEKNTEDTEGSGEPEGTIGLEDLLQRGKAHVEVEKSIGPTQFRSTLTTACPASCVRGSSLPPKVMSVGNGGSW